MPKKSNGITLIEILVAIVILGILTLSFFIIAPTQLKKAKDARRKTDLERIKVALYDYYFDSNCFPKSLPGCGQNFAFDGLSYLNNFPCDPKGDSYGYQVEDKECSQWFKILTNLEISQDPSINKVGCRDGCGPNCEYNYGLSSTNIKVNQGCVTYYACGPSGDCAAYEDPARSRCPRVFENDPTCGGGCSCKGKEGCCHDESGKRVPYTEGPEPTKKPKKK